MYRSRGASSGVVACEVHSGEVGGEADLGLREALSLPDTNEALDGRRLHFRRHAAKLLRRREGEMLPSGGGSAKRHSGVSRGLSRLRAQVPRLVRGKVLPTGGSSTEGCCDGEERS